MNSLPGGGYTIDDRLEISGGGEGYFVFGRGWLLEIVDIDKGDYCFLSDGKEVRPLIGHFGVFYPPFSFVKPSIRNVTGRVRGVGSVEIRRGLPKRPFIFETDFDGDFVQLDQAIKVIDSAEKRSSIEVNSSPSLLSQAVKRLIDENYLVYPSIARIAARLKVSHAHLSRQFKKDYGLSPGAYLHHLRVAEATFRLAVGEPIIDVSHEVGYNDLSRFYKQFRKATSTSPAVCRTMLVERRTSKNAKTPKRNSR